MLSSKRISENILNFSDKIKSNYSNLTDYILFNLSTFNQELFEEMTIWVGLWTN